MSSKNILKMIKDKQVEFVDLRFTDPKGKLQHLTMDSTVVDEDLLDKGVFFDGSSIAGWKVINESDMVLKPDLARPIIDPFNSHTTLNIVWSMFHGKRNQKLDPILKNQSRFLRKIIMALKKLKKELLNIQQCKKELNL